MDLVRVVLFVAETYHAVSHFFILFGIRMLPRKDLVKVRYYFLIDTSCVFLCTYLYLNTFWWLCALQMTQHIYYFASWNKSKPCQKIISWSSLDWDTLKMSRFAPQAWDLVLGTTFDFGVHVLYSYMLFKMSSVVGIMITFSIVALLTWKVLFNPNFAWSSPRNIPNWVQQRIKQLTSVYN